VPIIASVYVGVRDNDQDSVGGSDSGGGSNSLNIARNIEVNGNRYKFTLEHLVLIKDLWNVYCSIHWS